MAVKAARRVARKASKPKKASRRAAKRATRRAARKASKPKAPKVARKAMKAKAPKKSARKAMRAGSYRKVWNGTKLYTKGGLMKKDLCVNKNGKVVSKKMAKRNMGKSPWILALKKA